jgi:hypothetical protein
MYNLDTTPEASPRPAFERNLPQVNSDHSHLALRSLLAIPPTANHGSVEYLPVYRHEKENPTHKPLPLHDTLYLAVRCLTAAQCQHLHTDSPSSPALVPGSRCQDLDAKYIVAFLRLLVFPVFPYSFLA